MLLSPEERTALADLVNASIDIPLIPDEIEGAVFQHALNVIDAVLEEALPQPFHQLLRDAKTGIDKDHAQAFADKLISVTSEKFDLPYLSDEQELQLLRIVINALVKAMIQGRKLDDLLPTLKQE